MVDREQLKEKLPVELVPGWKRAYKWASVQISAVSILIFGALEIIQSGLISLPKHLLDMVPYGSRLALILSSMTLIGRLYQWKKKNGRE